jgi:phosphoglycerol transferase
MSKSLKNILQYSAAPILSLLIFAILFQTWKIDLNLPIFNYSHDALFSAFEVKSVIDNRWFLTNDYIGFPQSLGKFNHYDFPLQADSINFLIAKFFALFTSNPFLVTNCFFLSGFALNSALSFAVLRSFKISVFSAVIVSVLYAFTPYHFSRNVMHMFLGNYMAIPLITMLALWIMMDKIQIISCNKKHQLCFAPNSSFFIAAACCCFIAANGIYYALYATLIFIFAWFLRNLKKDNFVGNISSPIALCGVIIFVLFLLYLPSFSYWFQNGGNSSVGNRNPIESEYYGLKIINLFLPVANHYIDYLRNIRFFFDELPSQNDESGSESLGILASTGFLFLILWLFAQSQAGEKSVFQKTIKKYSLSENDQNLISNLAGLNLLSVLFVTIGGFMMFIAISFPLIRSHARFSIFIAFFSLFIIAIIFDKAVKKKKLWAKITILIISTLAIFDQVGKVSPLILQSEKTKSAFISDHNFVQKIESIMPKEAMIFVLPVVDFPENAESYDLLRGYLHSKNLRWSYPAIMSRPSSLWQNEVVKMNFKNFISEIKNKGFNGIYLNQKMMAEKFSWSEVRQFIKQLKQISQSSPLVSTDFNLMFFEI